jgi:hypothetical protein
MPTQKEEEYEKIKRWRSSAEEYRAAAAETKTAEGRRNLLDMANNYDIMADRAEVRLKAHRGPGKPQAS